MTRRWRRDRHRGHPRHRVAVVERVHGELRAERVHAGLGVLDFYELRGDGRARDSRRRVVAPMTGYGFTFAEVAEIARDLGIGATGEDLRPGRGGVTRCSFRLALDSTRPLGERPYQRVSMSRLNGDRPRRVAAVCFHGHRDVFRALFERHPAARIVSARARYDGREHFEASYHAQAAGEASPYGYFTSYADACECDDVTRSDDGHRVEFGTLDAELGR